MQYKECSDPLDDIDESPECMFLTLSTDDEMDHIRGREGLGRKRELPAVAEWSRMELFSTLEGSGC